MSATRYLIGPRLLMALCLNKADALQWLDQAIPANCLVSVITIGIVRSTIEADLAAKPAERDTWTRALDVRLAEVARHSGAPLPIDQAVADRWHLLRKHEPLTFKSGRKSFAIGQDVRLLLATAQAYALTFVDYDDEFHAEARRLGIDVETLP